MPETTSIQSPLSVPQNERKLIKYAKELVEVCRASVGNRLSYYRGINTFVETGRQDGVRSLVNLLHFHEERLSSHLYSPASLRFTIEAEQEYPKSVLLRMLHAAKLVTKQWERNDTDTIFGQGVNPALRYGCCLLKQWVERTNVAGDPNFCRALVMPWQFGVYREDIEELHRQPAFVETNMLSLPEIWHRIQHLPNANELYRRIETHAQVDNAGNEAFGFFHQVLSTSVLQTGLNQNLRPLPGGIVNLNSAPNYSIQGPEIRAKTVPFHELWVWDESDYCTIQYIEPDILIAPLFKKSNLLIPQSKVHPYTTIRPNPTPGNFWGRSEAADIMQIQAWISETSDDVKRLLGLQVDKILAFIGDDTITDENYGVFRQAGYVNLGMGSDVKDITPSFPPQALEILSKLENLLDKIGGFGNILDGGGEPGVRSGNHAQTLVRTASPTLRDRSLLIERQCAKAADLTLTLMKAKDATTYWTEAENFEKTSFTLAELPDDCMVTVDSHSSSPIFAEDHVQLVFACMKAGIIDAATAIELLPLPQKDLLQARLVQRELAQQQMLKKLEAEDPAAFAKAISKGKR